MERKGSAPIHCIGEFLYDSLVPSHATSCMQKALQSIISNMKVDFYSTEHRLWSSPSLGITQMCSSNLVLEYSDKLTVLGTPVYAADGCHGNKYYSFFILSKAKYPHITTISQAFSQLSDLTVAVNSFGSCSGWIQFLNSLSTHIQRHSGSDSLPFNRLLQTGSHTGSIRAVASGIADIASIDCISFQLLRRGSPELFSDLITVIGQSEHMLAPAYVTSNTHSADTNNTFRSALTAILSSQESSLQDYRQASLVTGIDTSTTLVQYQQAIQSFIHNIKRIPLLQDLLSYIPPGQTKPLRQPLTLKLKDDTNDEVTIISKARQDDVQWVDTDWQVIQRLRLALVQYLVNEIAHALANNSSEQQQQQQAVFTATCQSLVSRGEQFLTIPGEGIRKKGKLILPSYHGLLVILLSITLSEASEEHGLKVLSITWPHPLTTRLLHTLTTKAMLDVPDLVAEYLPPPQQREQQQEQSVVPALHVAFFLGATAPHMIDHSTNTAEASQVADILLKRVWAADLSLSQRLIRIGDELGVWAYLTGPRGNDRGDWGNLVIGKDGSALTRWRLSDGHNAGTQVLAPNYYELIRLHRVEFVNGLLSDDKCKLYQTIFLHAEDATAEELNAKTDDAGYQAAKGIMQQLYIESPIAEDVGQVVISSDESRGEVEVLLPKKVFRRRVIRWCDHNNSNSSSQEEEVLVLSDAMRDQPVPVHKYRMALASKGLLG